MITPLEKVIIHGDYYYIDKVMSLNEDYFYKSINDIGKLLYRFNDMFEDQIKRLEEVKIMYKIHQREIKIQKIKNNIMKDEKLEVQIIDIFNDQLWKSIDMYPRLLKIIQEDKSKFDLLKFYLRHQITLMKELNKYYTDGIEEICEKNINYLEQKYKLLP